MIFGIVGKYIGDNINFVSDDAETIGSFGEDVLFAGPKNIDVIIVV
jgi:hypothetical protein